MASTNIHLLIIFENIGMTRWWQLSIFAQDCEKVRASARNSLSRAAARDTHRVNDPPAPWTDIAGGQEVWARGERTVTSGGRDGSVQRQD